MKSPLAPLLMRWTALALGVLLATRLVHGIHCDDLGSLVVAVLLLSFFNTILRPVLLLFTLPFIIFTMGLGVVVINAILFLLVGRIVSGFAVDGFMPAIWGSIVVSLTNLVVSVFVGRPGPRPPRPRGGAGGDVIDI